MLLTAALAIKVAITGSPEITGPCQRTRVHFAGRISSDTPGNVRYTWVRSDKPSNSTFTLQFDKPGSMPVTYDWLLKGPAEGWVVLQVISPEQSHTERVRFAVSCKK
jgi:hypothetical protein